MNERTKRDTRFDRRQILNIAAGFGVGTLGGFGSTARVVAEGGDERWSFRRSGAADSPLTIVDGTVFVGGYKTLYALDAGVDGSSSDSRVLLGTLGHHDDRRIPDVDVAGSSNTALKVGGVAGLVGAGYLIKRRYSSNKNE